MGRIKQNHKITGKVVKKVIEKCLLETQYCSICNASFIPAILNGEIVCQKCFQEAKRERNFEKNWMKIQK